MVVNLDNCKGIFVERAFVFIRWKLCTWSGCGRNDWCEEKNYNFNKRKWKEIVFVNLVSKIEKVVSEESCCRVGVVMCCSLNCRQHFPHQMTRILKHKFGNKSFEEKFNHTLDIPRRLHWRGDCNNAKFVTFQERDVCEIAWYKIMGISTSTYMNYK